jgi:cysteine protease ATG4
MRPLPVVIKYLVGRVYDGARNFVIPFTVKLGHPVSFLGIEYESTDTDDSTPLFLDDFQSRIFLPYRQEFEPIEIEHDKTHSSLVSDQGWGCTIRSTQMIMAQSLISILLGRDFRFSSATEDQIDLLRWVIWRFADHPDAELSIHRIVSYGAERLSIPPGSWFGPHGAAMAVIKLWSHSKDIGVLYSHDGSFNPAEIHPKLSQVRHGLILLTGLRLGMFSVDLQIYKQELMRLFKHPMFQGMVGGDLRRAFYIPAVSDEFLYCLDPHVVHPALNHLTRPEGTALSMSVPLRMPWERLNPQMLLAFSVRSTEEAHELFAFMRTSKLFSLEDASALRSAGSRTRGTSPPTTPKV